MFVHDYLWDPVDREIVSVDSTYFEILFGRCKTYVGYAMHFWNDGAPHDQLTEVHNLSHQPSL